MDGATPLMTRRDWLGVLARAPAARLKHLCRDIALPAGATWLRRAEVGTVMVRGRAGGTGAAFNLGEITVTRASLQLADGTVGHGHVQGRDKAAAGCAALCDALLQTDRAGLVLHDVVQVLADEAAALAATRAARAAETRVEFFTLVRGEDQ